MMTNDPMSSKLPSEMHSKDLHGWHKTQASAEDMVCPPGQRVMFFRNHRNISVVNLWPLLRKALQYHDIMIDCDSIIYYLFPTNVNEILTNVNEILNHKRIMLDTTGCFHPDKTTWLSGFATSEKRNTE